MANDGCCAGLNWNVRVALVYAPLVMAASGLMDTPVGPFVLLLTQSNTYVGIASGTTGICSFIFGLASGAIADRFGRQPMLRCASIVAVFTSGYTLTWLLYFQHRTSSRNLYLMLLSSQLLKGLQRGLQGPAIDAIFGDSVESGRRSKLYAWRSSLRKLGGAAGPAIAAAIFLATGDEWTDAKVTWVLVAGCVARLLPAALLWLYRDARSLGIQSEGLHVRAADASALATAGDTSAAPAPPALGDSAGLRAVIVVTDPACAGSIQDGGPRASSTTAVPYHAEDAGHHDASAPPQARARRGCRPGPQHIAPLIATSDFLGKIGSGLSVHYFALYFWRSLDMRPSQVCLALIGNQLGGAVWTLAAQKLSLLLGRIQVVLLFKCLGIGMLVGLALCPLQVWYTIVPMYLMRTWLMNAPISLSRSVLNDYVAKKHRAKWASLNSVNASTWAGSACIGGYLVDRIGYQHVFLVTAAIQALALLLYVPLASLVVLEGATPVASTPSPAANGRGGGGQGRGSSSTRAAGTAAPQLAAPLLQDAGPASDATLQAARAVSPTARGFVPVD